MCLHEPPFFMRSKNLVPSVLLLTALWLAPASLRAGGKAEFDEAPVPVKSVTPDYPMALKAAGVNGMVLLTVVINENGDVQESTVAKSTRAEFEGPAIEAVAKWKFRPARKDGANVKVHVNIPIKFSTE